MVLKSKIQGAILFLTGVPCLMFSIALVRAQLHSLLDIPIFIGMIVIGLMSDFARKDLPKP